MTIIFHELSFPMEYHFPWQRIVIQPDRRISAITSEVCSQKARRHPWNRPKRGPNSHRNTTTAFLYLGPRSIGLQTKTSGEWNPFGKLKRLGVGRNRHSTSSIITNRVYNDLPNYSMIDIPKTCHTRVLFVNYLYLVIILIISGKTMVQVCGGSF